MPLHAWGDVSLLSPLYCRPGYSPVVGLVCIAVCYSWWCEPWLLCISPVRRQQKYFSITSSLTEVVVHLWSARLSISCQLHLRGGEIVAEPGPPQARSLASCAHLHGLLSAARFSYGHRSWKRYLGLALEPELAETYYSVPEELRFPKTFWNNKATLNRS